ncbi:MAG TPA: TIGR02680 family protein, partial [Naasia sp.]
APAWRRDPRDGRAGSPLWRLVDFTDDLDTEQRAGLEAALEASGLLDAWVRPDGAVLDPERHDTVLARGAAVAGPTLSRVLTADPPGDAGVTAEVVGAVLDRIVLGASGGPSGTAALGLDGAWRLGPLTGRAGKPVAQYVGATARAAERVRRLAELDARLAGLDTERLAAAAGEQAARHAAGAVEAWLSAVPSAGSLLTAWTLLDERESVAQGAVRRATEAEAGAAEARAAEGAQRRALTDLAATHGLPVEAGPLAARREALRELDRALAAHAERAAALAGRTERWADAAATAAEDVAEAAEAAGRAEEAAERAGATRAAAEELEATVGADVREIRRRIADAERRDGELDRTLRRVGTRLEALLREAGAAERAAADAAQRLAEQEPALADAVTDLGALGDTPGLLDSGGGGPEPGVLDLARGYTAAEPVPAAVLALARELAALDPPPRVGTEAAVWAAWQDAASGPAGDVDPRVTEIGGALAVIGRDDAGEHPVGELAARLAAAVERDAELLTGRERRLFEEHILGDLGESLRARRQESEELVAEMNRLLRGVTTSQGIAVTLRWALRDDVAADARRAVELLGRPVGALLPDERRELRDALHRLIEASRVDAPEDSYTEHLTRALDYRRWFAFRIRYTRPETAGTWHDLHRRSPLSQGEQKVVCYLPLFAAAAAHFSSLAGAAPHSPRFVLLDDAFPKIDVRTHPLLFGLLVQLDLDFVITSERLWGDHAEVPSLAIYEALRDPNERGIAQYRHHWDGQRLRAVG